MTRFLIAAALAALPGAAFAQTLAAPSPAPAAPLDICSSGLGALVGRPTQTTSACTVKPNQVLVESGYQTQTVDAARSSYTYQTAPGATIRIGTALRDVELQVLPPAAIRAGGVTALSDAGAGLKWQIGSTPSFAYGLGVSVTVPTGTAPAANPNGLGSSNAAAYTANANVQGALGKIFGYGATLSVGRLAAAAGAASTRYTSVIPSLDVTAALSPTLTLAVEGYRQSNGEGPATPSHTWFDAALEQGVGRAQFDLDYGASNRIAPAPGAPGVRRRYAGLGLSYLF